MEIVTTNVTAAAASISGNIIWYYIAILAVIVLLPHIIDTFKAYKSQSKIREMLVEKAAQNGLNAAELKDLLKEAAKSPPGIIGLTRGVIALSVIVILGIALFHLLITRTAGDNQVISNILAMVGSLVAAIVGFYFGGRSKDKASEEATEEVTEKTAKEAAQKAAKETAKEILDKVKPKDNG